MSSYIVWFDQLTTGLIGGGLPLAGFGEKTEIMECLAPLGGVYQAGTLSGNPVAVSLGLATLEYLTKENPYSLLEKRTKMLTKGILNIAREKGVPIQVSNIGSMFGRRSQLKQNGNSSSQ